MSNTQQQQQSHDWIKEGELLEQAVLEARELLITHTPHEAGEIIFKNPVYAFLFNEDPTKAGYINGDDLIEAVQDMIDEEDGIWNGGGGE